MTKYWSTYPLFFSLLASLLVLPLQTTLAKDPAFYAPQSKLASGKWVKLQVSNNAIYSLSYEEIEAMGIDPTKASIYGYGGWILDENFANNTYLDDLPEVPIWISGNNQQLSPGGFLLFYGKGTIKWSYQLANREYVHELNPYSEYGYYFITDSQGPPSVLQQMQTETAEVGTKVEVFEDYALHEKELNYVIASGRELYGENFKISATQNFNFSIDGLVQEESTARLRFVSCANLRNTTVTASSNESSLSYTFPYAVTTDIAGYLCDKSWSLTPKAGNTVEVKVSYSHPGFNAYLDYIRLNVQRELKPYGAYTFFRKKFTTSQNVQYHIKNASQQLLVWDISPNKTPVQLAFSFNNGETLLKVKENSDLREYVLVDPTKSFPKPQVVGEVATQDLHGLSGKIDMVIITQPIYWESAELLAQKHQEISNLRVEIVDANQIYNEFSSGTPDASAYRRFMKMLYDRGLSKNEEPKYLLLIGDTSHDNRLLTTPWQSRKAATLLLSYQSKASLNNDNTSYVTDDYFGYLNDDNGITSSQLHLGIGRLPVNNALEAQTVVNKIIQFMENKDSGPWKNRTIFIGGDEKDFGQYLHIEPSDNIAEGLVAMRPEMYASKIYYNSFKKVNVGYDTYPGAVEKLNNSLKEGAVLLNFLGHGDPTKIDKNVINLSSINQMRHSIAPLWILGTCSFSWYDDLTPSAGEQALLNANSGAIATISAARIVNVSGNIDLNRQIVNSLFKKNKQGEWPRLGDALREGKNKATDRLNKLSYALMGDPALSLNLPYYTVQLDSINGKGAYDESKQFRSEELIELKGSILNAEGELALDFTGKLHTTLSDCINQIETNDYRGTGTFNYEEYLNTLYQGYGTVVDGKFSIKIPIPRDISFKDEAGKLSFYAVSSSTKNEASGHFTHFTVGGSVDRDELEIDPPVIKKMYLNSSNFTSGEVVNERPYFVAEVFDEVGINRSGVGIGHNIELIIDNKPLYSYNLNNYYTDSETEAGYGSIRFLLPDSLSAGKHSLLFRVWNTRNVSAYQTLDFVVRPGRAPEIITLYTTPNPAKESLTFVINHDRAEANIQATIEVFDLSGAMVWQYKLAEQSSTLPQTSVYWDLTANNQRIKAGIYLYRVKLSTPNGEERSSTKKLVVLVQ